MKNLVIRDEIYSNEMEWVNHHTSTWKKPGGKKLHTCSSCQSEMKDEILNELMERAEQNTNERMHNFALSNRNKVRKETGRSIIKRLVESLSDIERELVYEYFPGLK